MNDKVIDLLIKSIDEHKENTEKRFDEIRDDMLEIKTDMKSLLLYRAKIGGMGVLAGSMLVLVFEIGKILLEKI